MHKVETEEGCGGIFADDMGMGKTFTVIAFVLSLTAQIGKKDKDKKPYLIIVPCNARDQWFTSVLDASASKVLISSRHISRILF